MTVRDAIILAFDAAEDLDLDREAAAWWAAWCVTTCRRGLWGVA